MLFNSVPLLCYAIQTMCDAISSTLNYLYPQCVRKSLRHEACRQSILDHSQPCWTRNMGTNASKTYRKGVSDSSNSYLTRNAIGKVHLA